MRTSKKAERVVPTAKIRIIFQGECTKLTARGKGTLSYEFGVDDESKEQFIRISGNSTGGTFSVEWISIKSIETLLEHPDPKNPAITAEVFRKLFVGRSANNHGYLAAILRAENVIAHTPEQASQLTYLSFKEIKAKFKSMQSKDIDLPDHVAANLKLREEKRKAAIPKKPPKKVVSSPR